MSAISRKTKIVPSLEMQRSCLSKFIHVQELGLLKLVMCLIVGILFAI